MTSWLSFSRLALLMLVVSSAALFTRATLTCPPGQALYGKRCYKTYRPGSTCDHDFTFDEANDFCQDNNGVLASVHSQAQADFLTALIKADQKAKQKACSCAAESQSCACKNANQDYLYWIGMQLTHSANQQVNGASWTDGTAVNYGNPTSASFRPPFIAGRPVGSANDGLDDSEVCPGGNHNNCVQVYGFGGKTLGRWRDQKCNSNHTIQQTCCDEPEGGNSTVGVPSKKKHHRRHSSSSSSGSSESEVGADECRDQAALNGMICQYCPVGFTPFRGHCYKAVMGGQSNAQSHAACAALDAEVVSIHSNEENAFVAALANAAAPGSGAINIGLQLVFPNNVFQQPPTGATWSDGSDMDYGNPLVVAPGTYPWAPQDGLYPAQPDNRPPPGNCVIAWLPNNPHPIGTWDDFECGFLSAGGTVCKI